MRHWSIKKEGNGLVRLFVNGHLYNERQTATQLPSQDIKGDIKGDVHGLK